MSGRGEAEGPDWTDLAGNAPGIGISYEAARRRQADGVGTDRSWRVGADGEVAVAQVLAELTEPSRWDRLRGRPPSWWVLHSVPLGDGRGRVRGDVDHVLIGPPGVVTINAKHHRAGRLELDGEALVVNGRPSEYVRRARREAERVAEFLRPALTAAGSPELAGRVAVRPMPAIVGGRLLITRWAPGVTVVMTRQLVHACARSRRCWTRPRWLRCTRWRAGRRRGTRRRTRAAEPCRGGGPCGDASVMASRGSAGGKGRAPDGADAVPVVRVELGELGPTKSVRSSQVWCSRVGSDRGSVGSARSTAQRQRI